MCIKKIQHGSSKYEHHKYPESLVCSIQSLSNHRAVVVADATSLVRTTWIPKTTGFIFEKWSRVQTVDDLLGPCGGNRRSASMGLLCVAGVHWCSHPPAFSPVTALPLSPEDHSPWRSSDPRPCHAGGHVTDGSGGEEHVRSTSAVRTCPASDRSVQM